MMYLTAVESVNFAKPERDLYLNRPVGAEHCSNSALKMYVSMISSKSMAGLLSFFTDI